MIYDCTTLPQKFSSSLDSVCAGVKTYSKSGDELMRMITGYSHYNVYSIIQKPIALDLIPCRFYEQFYSIGL